MFRPDRAAERLDFDGHQPVDGREVVRRSVIMDRVSGPLTEVRSHLVGNVDRLKIQRVIAVHERDQRLLRHVVRLEFAAEGEREKAAVGGTESDLVLHEPRVGKAGEAGNDRDVGVSAFAPAGGRQICSFEKGPVAVAQIEIRIEKQLGRGRRGEKSIGRGVGDDQFHVVDFHADIAGIDGKSRIFAAACSRDRRIVAVADVSCRPEAVEAA